MTPPVQLAWEWRAVATASKPQAAVACGSAARQLLERLVALPEAQQKQLSATANADMLVVIGPESALPWIDGIAYAAPHDDAASLWLPTHQHPDAPCDLLAQNLVQRYGRQPLLLWPHPPALVPLDRQLPLTPALIGRIAAHWQPDD